MLCINPYKPRKGVEFGCGQCRCCRVNRQRTWVGRLVLESLCHPAASFVTLTYAPDHLPREGLSSDHWRELTKGIGYRYFGVGEYGDTYQRPHYHVVLFGPDAMAAQWICEDRWPYGHVHTIPLETKLIAYVSRYTTKKYLSSGPPPGQTPEFQRMSRRPAIGAVAVSSVFDWLTDRAGVEYIARNRDVPNSVRHQGVTYPLGRTLVLKLRAAAGLPDALPETMEERRLARLAVDSEDFRSALENRRVRDYERATARVHRRGSL